MSMERRGVVDPPRGRKRLVRSRPAPLRQVFLSTPATTGIAGFLPKKPAYDSVAETDRTIQVNARVSHMDPKRQGRYRHAG